MDIKFKDAVIKTDADGIRFTGDGIVDVTTSGSSGVEVEIAGGGGVDVVFNTSMRYAASDNPDAHRLELTSTGDYFGSKKWNRSSTTLSITSSAHGLATGDTVMMRNGSEDYTYSAITRIDNDHFSLPVANSGGTSGEKLAYVPAFSASVTETSGDVTAITITAPSALSGSCQLHGMLLYAHMQESSPIRVTLPSGTQEGAGSFGAKDEINVANLTGISADGTGNSGTLPTLNQQWSLGSGYNELRITGVDNFTPIIVKAQFF